ncbi:MAG: 16S rRNA (guanine(966)-N(2))-methyltransferase RsmD [Clostridiales bacterium]|nr:16S rRNA (guanine(966)-N(2))-methyltransferase RsmD [Clostridiales bacterium]
MRVITGTARGTRLLALEGPHTRPTAERVKEAMFSSIQFEINGRTALDLFAGNGQLGLEALSRGAHRCDFVDNSAAAIRVVQANVERCGFLDRAGVFQLPFEVFLRQAKGPYSLIFLDPPYGQGLVQKAVERLCDGLLARHAILLCETAADEQLPERFGPLALQKTARYGNVRTHLYKTAEVSP